MRVGVGGRAEHTMRTAMCGITASKYQTQQTVITLGSIISQSVC
jgi:hypothetical protein